MTTTKLCSTPVGLRQHRFQQQSRLSSKVYEGSSDGVHTPKKVWAGGAHKQQSPGYGALRTCSGGGTGIRTLEGR